MSAFNWYNPLTWGYGWINAPATVDQSAPQTPLKPTDTLKRTPYYFGAGGIGMLGQFPPYVDAPPLTDNTMRAMSMHSNLAFIYANVVKPISASTYTVEVNPAMAEKPGMAEKLEKRKKYIAAALRANAMGAIRSACRSLQYGRWTQEVIYDRIDGFTVPVRFKSFRPWEVQLLRDPYDDFAGVRYQGIERDARYVFHHVNDPEIDPIFGYSRHGNVLPEWWHKLQDAVELSRLSKKAASIVPIVKGPSGKRPDVDGSMKDGLTICKGIAAALSRGEPVYMPQYLFEEDALDSRNSEITKFTAFDIDTVDLGDQGPEMMALLAKMAYEDVSFSRGWHQPERSSMEGSHGTKAEAGVHKAGSIEDSETVFRDIISSFNCGPLDQTLISNDGPEAKGSIFLKAAQLQDPDKSFKQDLIKAGMTNANAAPEMLANVDQRKLMEEAEVPLKSQDEADAALEEIQHKSDAQQQQKLEAMKQANGNGNGSVNGNGKVPAISASADTHYGRLASRLARYLDDDDSDLLTLSADNAEGHWVTIDGVHVFISDSTGRILEGPASLVGKKPDQIDEHHHDKTDRNKPPADKRKRFSDSVHKSIDKAGLSAKDAKQMHESVDKAVGNLHPNFIEAAEKNLNGGIFVHKNIAKFEEHIGANLPQAIKGASGIYLPKRGEIHLIKTKGVDVGQAMAHEMTHAADVNESRTGYKSDTDDKWATIHKEEIAGGQLSKYATNNLHEGIAEYGRLVAAYPDRAQKYFPKASSYWSERGFS